MSLKKYCKSLVNAYFNKESTVVIFEKLSARFCDALNIAHNPRLLPIYSKLFYIGLKNTDYIPQKSRGLWPFWVYKLLDPNSIYFSPRGFQPLTLNTIYRNWTMLSLPGCDETAIIDPKGLLTPSRWGWSLDIWLNIQGKSITPSQLPAVKQTLQNNFPLIQTNFDECGIKIQSDVFLKTDINGSTIIFSKTTLENTTSEPIPISFIYAIRPYNPEGVSPIEDITYLSGNAFIINRELGLILDQKPQNVICLPNSDGDLTEQLNKWDMLLACKCPDKMASAAAEFKLTLAPQEKKFFSCKIPLQSTSKLLGNFQTALKPYQFQSLKNQILDYQALHHDKEKESIKVFWKELDQEICALSLPDKHIESLFHQNLYHLHNFIGKEWIYAGSFTFKEFWIRPACMMAMALNRIGSATFSKKILENVMGLSHLPHSDTELDTLGQMCFTLYDTFEYSQDIAFLKKAFAYMESLIHKIESKRSYRHHQGIPLQGLLSPNFSYDLTGTPDCYLWDNYWAIAGLESASKAAKRLVDLKKAQHFTNLAIEFRQALKSVLTTQFEKNTQTEYLPGTFSTNIDSRLAYSLIGAYLNIENPESDIVTTSLQIIDTQFAHNHVYLSQVGQGGFDIFQNTILAQIYALRKDPVAFDILKWLTQTATQTGSWPTMIHPKTLGGIIGDGHDGTAAAGYIQLVNQLLIQEKDMQLFITPFIPISWLSETTPALFAKQMMTRFGRINFSYYYTPKKITYQIETHFHTEPSEIRIYLPITIQKAKYSKIERDIYNNYVNIPANCTKVELSIG